MLMIDELDKDEALIQQATLSSLRVPREHDRNVLRNWVIHEDGGNGFWEGVEDEPFQRSLPRKDFVALSSRPEFDPFSNFLIEKIVRRVFRNVYGIYQVRTSA